MSNTFKLKDTWIGVCLFISFLINFIFFTVYSPINFTVLLVSQFFITFWLSANLTSKGFAKFLIFVLVLFPKKNLGEDVANKFLLERMHLVDGVAWIYFDNILLPILTASWILVKASKVEHLVIPSLMLILAALGLFSLNLFYPVRLTFWEYIPNLNILLFAMIFIHRRDFESLKYFFMNCVILLLILFCLEIVLVSFGILPFSLSYDWREGFRSLFIGFAVQVGFWLMIATFSTLYLFLKKNSIVFLVLFILSVALQFLTFDRGNLYLSFLLIIILGLKYRFKAMILVLLIILCFSPYLFFLLKGSKMYEIKSNIDESGIIGTNSAFDRFEIQLNYIKSICNNFGLPSGVETNRIRYQYTDYSKLFFPNIEINQGSHSLFITSIFEYGVVLVLFCFIMVWYFIKKLNVAFEGYLLCVILLFFWSFQSTPSYLFLFPMVITLWSTSGLKKTKY